MDADTQYLPEDVIRNILTRIPVKPLTGFQCVSKQWKALIKTPSFMAEHARRQSPCLLFTGEAHRPLELRLLDCEMHLRQVQEPHMVSGLRSSSIMSSCNGLLCLRICPDTFCVWNPAIGELRMTPEVIHPDMGHSKVGFGFSPTINDYKIVIIWDSVFHNCVEVYSLTSGSWKVVEHEILEGICLYSEWESPSVTANGAIFWLGTNAVIVSFDIALELFTLIPVPDVAMHSWDSRLVVYENKLALFLERRLSENSKSIYFWAMEEEGRGWTKKYNTTFPCKASPLTIWENEIVCRVKDHAIRWPGFEQAHYRISLFDIATGEFDTFAMHDSYKCIDYVESLVPVGGNNLSAISM